MSEWFITPWGLIYFIVIELVILWHAWTWARSRNPNDYWFDLFLGRFALCQFAGLGFFLILNYATRVLIEWVFAANPFLQLM